MKKKLDMLELNLINMKELQEHVNFVYGTITFENNAAMLRCPRAKIWLENDIL